MVMASDPISPLAEATFWDNVAECSRFFMGTSNLDRALAKLVSTLETAQVPYAIAGAMALNEYGYRRVTEDIDILLTVDGLKTLKTEVLGRGYLEKFAGSKGLRDTENNVVIVVLLTGDFPGDGKPKPVSFPDPFTVARRGSRGAYLPLAMLIQLKLAAGISSLHRLKDLSDVLELIKAAAVPMSLVNELDASVQAKFVELWDAAQIKDEDY
jgi:hypothetical protein